MNDEKINCTNIQDGSQEGNDEWRSESSSYVNMIECEHRTCVSRLRRILSLWINWQRIEDKPGSLI